MKRLPIIFRADKSEVTAIFPTLPHDYHGRFMTCYAHVGQHGSCSLDWYRGTRPAKPAEYADLLAELRRIYSRPGDPDAVELVIYSRIMPQHRAALRQAVAGYQTAVAGESAWVQGRIGESVA